MTRHDSLPCFFDRFEFFPLARLMCDYNAEPRSSSMVRNLDSFEFKVSRKPSTTAFAKRRRRLTETWCELAERTARRQYLYAAYTSGLTSTFMRRGGANFETGLGAKLLYRHRLSEARGADEFSSVRLSGQKDAMKTFRESA